MSTYIIRRVALIIPALLLVTIVIFLSVRFIPGSVVQLMVANRYAQSQGSMEDMAAAIRHQLGLDVPVHIQYLRWLGVWRQEDGTFSGVFEGNLGESLWSQRPIRDEIFKRIPISLELGIIAIITALLLAFPVGIYSAIRQDTTGDYLGRSLAILCVGVPSFWLGTMIFVFPAKWWHWTPPVSTTPSLRTSGPTLDNS